MRGWLGLAPGQARRRTVLILARDPRCLRRNTFSQLHHISSIISCRRGYNGTSLMLMAKQSSPSRVGTGIDVVLHEANLTQRVRTLYNC